MKNWVWILPNVLILAQREQIAAHGGAHGLRDKALLESALARPLQRAAYSKIDAAALAAAYGFELVRNHPFVDGNKRIALIAIDLFLELNSLTLDATDEELFSVILALAGGTLEEDPLADWIRVRLRPT